MNKLIRCLACQQQSEYVVMRQIEEHFYKYDLATNDLKDFHGAESVLHTEYRCQFCGVIRVNIT